MEEVKNKYVVYGHYYCEQLFYIGSGRIYEKDEGFVVSRPYDFKGRTHDWKEFCSGNTDRIKVEILFETNDRQLAYDVEEQFIIFYIEHKAPLVNKRIGNKMRKSCGDKVLITNNQTQDTKVFSAIIEAHKFILEKGYPNKYGALKYHLRKGSYSFKEYTMELIA